VYQKCPHLGCRVPFCDSSQRFECPCHGSKFNLKGEYLAGPAPRGMDRFPIQVKVDQVVVDTGTVIEGPARGILTMPSEPAGPSCLGETGEVAPHMEESPGGHAEDMGDQHDAAGGGMP